MQDERYEAPALEMIGSIEDLTQDVDPICGSPTGTPDQLCDTIVDG